MIDPASLSPESLLPDSIGLGVAALLIVGSFFTSATTASFGIGGGVMMLALMGQFLPVAALIPVQGLVQFGSNAGRTFVQRAHINTVFLKPFLAGSVIGAAIGAVPVVQLPDALMKMALGAFILFITWGRIPGVKALTGAGLAIASAAIAFLTMFLGATGPLLASVVAAMIPGDRKAVVATSAAGLIVQHGLKVVAFGLAGFAFRPWLPLIAMMIGTGYLGTLTGSKLLNRMPEDKFRLGFKLILTVLALDLLRRGLSGTVTFSAMR
jgi:uncharacterized protein